MTDSIKKIPPWAIQLLVWVLSLVFFAGGAYEMFAPKAWVVEKIQQHEVRTEDARKEDMKEIKESLKRIEERQYQQAQQGKGK